MRLRCRVGLHRWGWHAKTDPDIADRRASAEWQTRCRECGRVQGTGSVWATVAFLVMFAVAVWCLSAGPPLLGAILMIGAVGGLLWSAGAVIGNRIVRWLTVGR